MGAVAAAARRGVVESDEELRVQRLIHRHIEFGKTPEYARAWVLRSDERNAALVAAGAAAPDVLVDVRDISLPSSR